VTTKGVFGILALGAATLILVSGQTPLDVKPGQWETTMTTAGGSPLASVPPGVLDRLTPDQRAKVEAQMKAGAGQQRTSVTSSCVTKEDISKAFQPSELPQTCKYNMTSSTASQIRMTMNCDTDKAKMTGTVQIDALDSEHVKGSTDMVASLPNGQPMNSKATFTSKWVGPACTEKKSGK
jgi:hypothetical protein